MSEASEPETVASVEIDQTDPKKLEIQGVIDHASRKFGEEYSKTENASILIAQHELLYLVRIGKMSPEELKGILEDQSKFEAILVISHAKFEARKDQEIRTRLANLDKNTHWKIAAAITLVGGMVTGLVFTVAGPFVTTLLQPTADKWLKHQPETSGQVMPQPQTAPNITNNNIYNFYAPEAPHARMPPSAAVKIDNKPKATLTCKNVSVDAYKASLLELLQRGDVVTLETNGKKVSMCYRPSVQPMTQQHALPQK